MRFQSGRGTRLRAVCGHGGYCTIVDALSVHPEIATLKRI